MKSLIKIIVTNFIFLAPLNNVPFITNTTNSSFVNNYKNLFVLGDSLSDTGAFVQYQGRLQTFYTMKKDAPAKCYISNPDMPSSWDNSCVDRVDWWNPRKMDEPFYRSSFSNGPVAVQLLANRLGIKNFTAGWYDKKYNLNQVGYNYATGSAKVLSSDYLLTYFSEREANALASSLESDRYGLVEQVAALKKHHPIIDANDLLIIMIGSNDILEIIEGRFKAVLQSTKEVLTARINQIIETLLKKVEELIDYGFKRIVVSNVPSLFLTPRFSGNLGRVMAQKTVEEYNKKFDLEIAKIKIEDKFKGKTKILPIDHFLKIILKKYQNTGVVTSNPAVEVNWVRNHIFQRTYSPYFIGNASLEKIDNYAFFDDIHPTARMHRDITELLLVLVGAWWPIT